MDYNKFAQDMIAKSQTDITIFEPLFYMQIWNRLTESEMKEIMFIEDKFYPLVKKIHKINEDIKGEEEIKKKLYEEEQIDFINKVKEHPVLFDYYKSLFSRKLWIDKMGECYRSVKSKIF